MLLRAATSCLLVVDLQERLMPAIYDAERILENATWLIKIAQRLSVPVLATEQYPQGLGQSVAAVRSLLAAEAFVDKVHFSAAAEHDCMRHLDQLEREQIVMIGTEAHVCVLQTALGLRAAGKEVYLVADAIGSRSTLNVELAIARMREEGVRIVSREMVAFEWLQRAATEQFRAISREFLR